MGRGGREEVQGGWGGRKIRSLEDFQLFKFGVGLGLKFGDCSTRCLKFGNRGTGRGGVKFFFCVWRGFEVCKGVKCEGRERDVANTQL